MKLFTFITLLMFTISCQTIIPKPTRTLLRCPNTQMIGFLGHPTFQDLATKEKASKQCVIKYPKSPCLVKLIKRGFNNYYAICGSKK